MQLCAFFGDQRLQDLPDLNGQNLGGGHLPLEEGHIHVQVPMVEVNDHVFTDQIPEPLQIHDKTCVFLDLSFDIDNEVEIVPMEMWIGTGSEDFKIPLIRPIRIVQPMGSIESLPSLNMNHSRQNFGKDRQNKVWGVEPIFAALKRD